MNRRVLVTCAYRRKSKKKERYVDKEAKGVRICFRTIHDVDEGRVEGQRGGWIDC